METTNNQHRMCGSTWTGETKINDFNLLVAGVERAAVKTLPSGARFSLHFKPNIRQTRHLQDIITVDTAQLRTT